VSNRTEASRFVHTGASARPRLVEAPAAALTPVHAVAADAA
jgi:hypothetical protein